MFVDSTPMKRSTSLLDNFPVSSTATRQVQNGIPHSSIPEFSGSLNANSSMLPYPTTQVLQEKIEQQNIVSKAIEKHKKTGLLGFRPGPIQTSLDSLRSRLER